MSDPRGDDWTLKPPCEECAQYRTHIEELEDSLAALQSEMEIMKSERDALLQVLVLTGKVIIE